MFALQEKKGSFVVLYTSGIAKEEDMKNMYFQKIPKYDRKMSSVAEKMGIIMEIVVIILQLVSKV